MKLNKKIVASIMILGGISVTLVGCGSQSKNGQSSGDNKKITAVGSTALQPLAEKAGSQFQAKNNGVSINVQGGGSGTGLSQVQDKAVQIGNSDIFAAQQPGLDSQKLVDHKVAVVGMTPVINKNIGISNLSMGQLKDIFTGKITNWKEVGGKNQKIVVVNRAKGSGTRKTFESAVLGKAEAVKSQEQDSNGTVQKVVSTTPGAISYLAFSYVNNKVNSISIDNVKPTADNVKNNNWKIWSYEHMYTNGKATGTTNKYLDFMVSNEIQHKLIEKLGYISIHDMKFEKDANNQVKAIH